MDRDWETPDGMLTPFQFRERVGKAMIRNDVDRVGDAASPFVTATAKEYRKLFNVIAKEGNAVGIFSTELRAELKIARELGDMQRVTEIEAALNKLRNTGPMVNTAASYLPRIPRIDKIDANPHGFLLVYKSITSRASHLACFIGTPCDLLK